MRTTRIPLRFLLCVVAFLPLGTKADTPLIGIVPRPVAIQQGEGRFLVTQATTIIYDKGDAESEESAQFLAELLRAPLGVAPRIEPSADGPAPDAAIMLTRRGTDASAGDESYQLNITARGVVIRSPRGAGLFYGIQTLRQLLPPQIERRQKVDGVDWAVPAVYITDAPRYRWRGLMLDVSRHFFTKPEIKRYLDAMALYKLNVFHWHLVDDQGWRVEIKKYPRLTEIGAWRKGVGFGLSAKSTERYDAAGRYGGFYTQDDIREIVSYAVGLHIMIVPEIEMPGHSSAALDAYPQFSCKREPDGNNMGGIYCAGNDETFIFIEDVLDEIIPLFPSPWFHVGGDEVSKDHWKKCEACQARIKAFGLKNEQELQSYFMKRIQTFLEVRHRHMIGWDEILEGGLAPGAAVMSWHGMSGGMAAARSGHDVVMTPTSHTYFDYYQSHVPGTPRAIGGFLPLGTVYSMEPTPGGLTPEQAGHVLGAQGNVWTEYVPNFPHAEYLTYPRACALAEVTWSSKEKRDFADFRERLRPNLARLHELGVNYFNALADGATPIGEWHPAEMSEKFHTLDWNVTNAVTRAGGYEITFAYTGGAHRLDIQWAALIEDGKEVARDTHNGTTGGKNVANTYTLKVAALAPGKTYALRASVRSDAGTDSSGQIEISRIAN